jgi:hypothetical protein
MALLGRTGARGRRRADDPSELVRYLDLILYGAGSVLFLAGTVVSILLRMGVLR